MITPRCPARRGVVASLATVALSGGCGHQTHRPVAGANPLRTTSFPVPRPADLRERHLANLRQLTDGGENAEACFSFDGTQLIFQSTRPPYGCDQIFTMVVLGRQVRRVSTGLGRTTCAYFYPDGRRFLYASTN